MRKPNPQIVTLEAAFHKQRILTMADVKQILSTDVNMTAYRILCTLSYLSSYSHAGKFYTLPQLAEFNAHGLWSYNDVHFSTFGTLKNTIVQILNKSIAGYRAKQLQALLMIPVANALLELYRAGQITRVPFGNEYIYVSISRQQSQIEQRQLSPHDSQASYSSLFFSTLNEQQRRWFAGLESLKLGHGGDKIVAQRTGLDVKTVAKGRHELIANEIDVERIRREGAGRPSIKKTKKSLR
jgi:hypothetical protein